MISRRDLCVARDGRAARLATRTRLRGAAAGDDEAQDRPATEPLRGSQYVVGELLKAEGFTISST